MELEDSLDTAASVVVIAASVDAVGVIDVAAVLACYSLVTWIAVEVELVVRIVAFVTSAPAAAMPSLSRPALAIGHPFDPTQMGYHIGHSTSMAHESDIVVAEHLCSSRTTLSTFPE